MRVTEEDFEKYVKKLEKLTAETGISLLFELDKGDVYYKPTSTT